MTVGRLRLNIPQPAPGITHFCAGGGHAVDPSGWLPDDPHDWFGESFGLSAVGCNHLICFECRELVRHAVGAFDQALCEDPRALALEPDWQRFASAPSRSGPRRLYACRCRALIPAGSEAMVQSSDDDPLGLVPHWRCFGHPTLTLPGALGGLRLDVTPDWGAVVAAHLRGAGCPTGHPRIDAHPGFILTRLYLALGEDVREGLAEAVAAYGGDEDVLARTSVALFFAQNPLASGFTSVLAAWRAQPERYAAQPVEWGPERSLRDLLLQDVTFRLGRQRAWRRPEEPALLETLRWAMETTPGPGGMVYALRHVDAEWAAEHVEQLVAAGPERWERTLLEVAADVAQLTRGGRAALRSGHASRPQLLAAIEAARGAEVARAVAAALDEPAP